MSNPSFADKFRINELQITETEYWIWSLRPHQATLGAGILSLKRSCSRYSELTLAEHSDVHLAVTQIESALRRAFMYDAINYLMLMMVDKHVHYHVLPRYRDPVTKFGRVWIDEEWPAVPRLSGESPAPDVLERIRQAIMVELR